MQIKFIPIKDDITHKRNKMASALSLSMGSTYYFQENQIQILKFLSEKRLKDIPQTDFTWKSVLSFVCCCLKTLAN